MCSPPIPSHPRLPPLSTAPFLGPGDVLARQPDADPASGNARHPGAHYPTACLIRTFVLQVPGCRSVAAGEQDQARQAREGPWSDLPSGMGRRGETGRGRTRRVLSCPVLATHAPSPPLPLPTFSARLLCFKLVHSTASLRRSRLAGARRSLRSDDDEACMQPDASGSEDATNPAHKPTQPTQPASQPKPCPAFTPSPSHEENPVQSLAADTKQSQGSGTAISQGMNLMA